MLWDAEVHFRRWKKNPKKNKGGCHIGKVSKGTVFWYILGHLLSGKGQVTAPCDSCHQEKSTEHGRHFGDSIYDIWEHCSKLFSG